MTDFLVDTSVWIDFFRGRESRQVSWLEVAAGFVEAGIPDLALAELLQGAQDTEIRKINAALADVDVVALGGEHFARQAARNYRLLRKRGVTIRATIDCLIATYALEAGLPLLHSDRDFLPFEEYLGLRSALDMDFQGLS